MRLQLLFRPVFRRLSCPTKIFNASQSLELSWVLASPTQHHAAVQASAVVSMHICSGSIKGDAVAAVTAGMQRLQRCSNPGSSSSSTSCSRRRRLAPINPRAQMTQQQQLFSTLPPRLHRMGPAASSNRSNSINSSSSLHVPLPGLQHHQQQQQQQMLLQRYGSSNLQHVRCAAFGSSSRGRTSSSIGSKGGGKSKVQYVCRECGNGELQLQSHLQIQ